MSIAKERLDVFVAAARETQRIRERDGWFNPTESTVIMALADERDEAVALLGRALLDLRARQINEEDDNTLAVILDAENLLARLGDGHA